MVWEDRMGPGVRIGLDCCRAALAIRVRAYDLAQKVQGVRWVGMVVQVGAEHG